MATSTASSSTAGTNPYQNLNQAGQATKANEDATSASNLQGQFLKMLLTQLQNQDPLNPMNSAETTSQMAQISTVSGIQQLNTTMTALSANMTAGYSYQATSLIGHSVLDSGSQLISDGKSQASFGVDIPVGTARMNIIIKDSNGVAVDAFSVDAPAPGNQQLMQWDGKDGDGNFLPAGKYSIATSMVGKDGTTQTGATYTFNQVASISFGANGVTLNLANGNQVPFTKITQVI
ncbi:flagellar biosynthesis protein FlgD [Burkholderiaceae bacterium DAT-1]|nr:flagellar biosynthesis protein FlgD [Burkholderiaceae bacterium DAT-1]